jgi:hypothetical protein
MEGATMIRKTYRLVWRRINNSHGREIFYCLADNQDHAREMCRAFARREFQVRKPVFIEIEEID